MNEEKIDRMIKGVVDMFEKDHEVLREGSVTTIKFPQEKRNAIGDRLIEHTGSDPMGFINPPPYDEDEDAELREDAYACWFAGGGENEPFTLIMILKHDALVLEKDKPAAQRS